MAWIEPIIDRTQYDVLYAMQNQSSIEDLKGAWNVSDVNRIINNVNYLHGLLGIHGYNSTITPQSEFVISDLPYVTSKIKVIRDNINAIVNSFYKLGNPIIRYGDIFDYNDANSLEQNLKITNDLLESLILDLKYSGNFYSGEEIIL